MIPKYSDTIYHYLIGSCLSTFSVAIISVEAPIFAASSPAFDETRLCGTASDASEVSPLSPLKGLTLG
jgi:hypothetical protein